MNDPWTEPSLLRTRGTRFVCPFDDWFHDEPDEALDEIPAEITDGLTTLEEMSHAIVTAQQMAKYKRIDGLIRRHLESHTLEEWFAAAVMLQRIQASAKTLTDMAAPTQDRIHEALCIGGLGINDARWIQAAKALIEALTPRSTVSDDA